MYPGYRLGCGAELERAMEQGLTLAVDVSHINIQLCAGVMSVCTWERLQRYAAIAEVHVSDNAGRVDSHGPLTADTFGLSWAKERCVQGIPLVLRSDAASLAGWRLRAVGKSHRDVTRRCATHRPAHQATMSRFSVREER